MARFRQRDIARAVRGAKTGGLDVARVEVDTVSGKIVLTTTDAVDASAGVPTTDLDQWLADHADTAKGH